jgi:hypothetical protein
MPVIDSPARLAGHLPLSEVAVSRCAEDSGYPELIIEDGRLES